MSDLGTAADMSSANPMVRLWHIPEVPSAELDGRLLFRTGNWKTVRPLRLWLQALAPSAASSCQNLTR